MSDDHETPGGVRRLVRSVPGVRRGWHAVLRANGRLQSAARTAPARARRFAGETTARFQDRRRRRLEARPIDHPTSSTRRELLRLGAANRFVRRSAVDPATRAVVTMTTHGERIGRVHQALESIARGQVRPGRLILWLDDERLFGRLPRPIRRLQRRGLEVRLAPNYKVHTKYYPYVVAHADDELPLVTSDDDILYPVDWLARLLDLHRRFPEDILAYRAHRITVTDDRLDSYPSWRPASGEAPSAANFGTSVSGQLFPASVQRLAVERGEEFRELSPDNDDIWLHAIAVEKGIRVRLVDGRSTMFPFLPKTQQGGLYLTNYWEGANDRQIASAYSDEAIRRIRSDLDSGTA